MKILEVETFGRGGLAHYVWNLSGALAGRGHEVVLATSARYELAGRPLPGGVRLAQPIGRLTSRIDRLPGPLAGLLRKAEAVRDAAALGRLARRLDPDVVHLHCTNPAALLHLRALRRARGVLAATAHVVVPHEPIPFQKPIVDRIHGIPDLVIAHSRVDAARLAGEHGVDPARIAVIPHGEYGFFEKAGDRTPTRSEARSRLGLDEDAEVALFFGYVREYKGLDVLLDAWPTVVAGRPRARLAVAGDPVRLPAPRRRELLARLDDSGAVHRFGYVPFEEVATWFAAADVLVMPYRRISQSGVLFLGLALGVPIVASAVGALPEMLRDGEDAVLVPPGDAAALASALARVLADPELQRRLAEGGLRVSAAHSWDSIAARTERAFERASGTSAATDPGTAGAVGRADDDGPAGASPGR